MKLNILISGGAPFLEMATWYCDFLTLINKQVISIKRLLRLFFAIVLVQLSSPSLSAQTPARLRSTLGISGSSKLFSSQGKQYFLVQSMGQSSVIGLSQTNKYLLRQGFIQPLNSSVPAFLPDILLAAVYPNPFSANITISVAEDVSGILKVTLIDMNGKISFLKTFDASQEIKLNVEALAPSIYILKVQSTKKSFYSKIIKF